MNIFACLYTCLAIYLSIQPTGTDPFIFVSVQIYIYYLYLPHTQPLLLLLLYTHSDTRWEASALFAEALTGLTPPPKPQSKCDWPSLGSLDLAEVGERGRGGGEVCVEVKPVEASSAHEKVQKGKVAGTSFEDAFAKAQRQGIFEMDVVEEEEEVVMPPYWRAWKKVQRHTQTRIRISTCINI